MKTVCDMLIQSKITIFRICSISAHKNMILEKKSQSYPFVRKQFLICQCTQTFFFGHICLVLFQNGRGSDFLIQLQCNNNFFSPDFEQSECALVQTVLRELYCLRGFFSIICTVLLQFVSSFYFSLDSNIHSFSKTMEQINCI